MVGADFSRAFIGNANERRMSAVLLVLNMALSDRIVHASGRAYNGIADGVFSGEGEKRIPRIEALSE